MTTTNTAGSILQIPQPGRYRIDTQKSNVTFKGRHMFGLATVRGTFAIRRGAIDVTDPIADSTVRVEIDTASFHTGNKQRDRDVRDAARPVTLTIEQSAVHNGIPASFATRATVRIDRTEFGVTAARGMAGRYFDVSLQILWVAR